MRKLLIITLAFAALQGAAQESRVNLFARVPQAGQVELKWFAPELYNQTGYYVERKSGGNWERLNTAPIMLAHVPGPQGEEMQAMVEISKRMAFSKVDGLMRLAIFLKATESEELANYFGMYYKDSNAPSGNVSYRLTDGNGNVLAGVETNAGQPSKSAAPQTPVVAPGDSMAFIDLEIENNRFYAYNILRSTSENGPFEKLNPLPLLASPYDTAEHFFTDRGLANGTTYYFVTEGLDYFGETSQRTVPVEVTPVDMTPPPAPTLLQASEENNKIVLTWGPVPAPDLVGYKVYRSPQIPGNYEEITIGMLPPSTARFEDSPEGPMVYYYQVRAVDQSGNESVSRDVFGAIRDLRPPQTPTGFQAETSEGEVRLSWGANAEPDLLGYWVYRSSNDARKDKYSLLNASPTLETAFTDKLPKKAKNGFHYYLIALDTNLNQSEPTEIIVAHLPDVTPPAPPFIEKISVGEGKATISFRAPLDRDLSAMTLLRKEQAATAWDTASTITDFAESNVADLPGNGNWEYALVATDSTGNESAMSNIYAVSVQETTALPPISSVSVTIGPDLAKPSVVVSWTAVEPEGLRGYIVYRKEGSGQPKAVSGLLTESTFTDSDIKPGTEYTYQVRTLSTTGKIAGSEESIIRVNE